MVYLEPVRMNMERMFIKLKTTINGIFYIIIEV